MKATKVFLDNNAYDKLLELDNDEFQFISENCSFCGCDTIDDELSAMKVKNPEKLHKIEDIRRNMKIVRIAKFGFLDYDTHTIPKNICGFASYDNNKEGIFMSYELGLYQKSITNFLDSYGKKKSKNKDNRNDSIIALLAHASNAILITYDGIRDNIPKKGNKNLGLYQAVKQNKGNVMVLSELIEYIKHKKLTHNQPNFVLIDNHI